MKLLIAMTAPFHAQFYASDDNQFCVFGSNYYAQVLLFCGISFNSKFRIRPALRFTFTIVDDAIVKHFMNFPGRNMAAIHPAPGMLRKNQFRMTVKRIMICKSMIRTIWIIRV